MDVTFREFEPFYEKSSELDSMFENDSTSASREGENVNGVVVGMNPFPIQISDGDAERVSETESQEEPKEIESQDDQQTELR
jgi:hypothetical protein